VESGTREKLILENKKLVEQIVTSLIRKFGLPYNIEKQDLISVGIIAMIEAIDSYSEDKGSLEKWISANVFGLVLNEIKNNKTRQSLEVHFDPDKLGESIIPFFGTELYDFSKNLNDLEFEIFKFHFILGMTQQEVADILNISIRNVKYKVSSIKQKIKETLSYDC